MKIIRFFALILAFSLCFNFLLCVGATETTTETVDTSGSVIYPVPEDFEIRAKAAMLIELQSGTLMYSYQQDLQLYPASLTKIMTCMLAIEHGNLDDVLH